MTDVGDVMSEMSPRGALPDLMEPHSDHLESVAVS